jgi:hypothetical protein
MMICITDLYRYIYEIHSLDTGGRMCVADRVQVGQGLCSK